MAKMIIRPDNNADYSIETMLDAFENILEATGSKLFSNISLNKNFELTYTVNENEITKQFNTDQGEPELKADIMEHLFSMLDAAANL